jgi:putative intracellular protease/amidase
MTQTAQTPGSATVTGRRRRRLAVVAGAVLAAVVVYLVETFVADTTLRTPAILSNTAPADLSVVIVIVGSAVPALLAWAVLALLERFTNRAHTIWTVVAVVAALVSLGGPLSGTGVTTGNRVALELMHLAVAAVLIPWLPGRAAKPQPVT